MASSGRRTRDLAGLGRWRCRRGGAEVVGADSWAKNVSTERRAGTGWARSAFPARSRPQCMTAWKSRSKIASSPVASPAVIMVGSRAARKPAGGRGGPVGVAGQRGLLRQGRQPGQQRRGRVRDQQVAGVGDPAGGGQLQRQQRQHPRGRGDDPRAGVARPRPARAGPGRSGRGGPAAARPCPCPPGRASHRIDARCRGQGGVAARRVPGAAGPGPGVAQQPAESFLGEDLADDGAVERSGLGGQPGGDLIAGQSPPAQRDHPAAGAVLAGATPGSGPGRRGGANRSSFRPGGRGPG